jgi:hypothetical protein
MPQLRRGGSKASPSLRNADGGVGTLTAPGVDGPSPAGGRSRRRYDPAWDEWQRPRRWPGILLSCAIVLGFLGVVVWHYRPHPKPPAAPAHYTKSQLKDLKPTFVVGASGIGVRTATYRGTGNKRKLPFSTNGQLLVLHATCACIYNFVVTISNVAGVPVSFPVSDMGNSDVTLNQSLDTGRYLMSVIGTGPWEVQLIQPTAATPLLPTAPRRFTYFSAGPSVLGPFSSANRYLFLQYVPGALGHIKVYVLDPAGIRVDEAFKTGNQPIKEGATLPRPSNPYYVEVVAGSGLWSLHVQRSSHG